MKKCAYCDKTDNEITKEHVVNKSFIDKYYKIGKGYANAYAKYTENYLTARDVCSKCNNENLSILDNYFLDFYENNIPENLIDSSSKVDLSFEFDKLSKWLLKTLYNSERKNSYEELPKKMHRYKNYILGKDNRTKLFKIYIELLQDIPKEEIKKYHLDSNVEIPEKLNFLRIGNIVFTDQIKTEIKDLIKHITSSNFVFHIFILDPGRHNDSNFKMLLEKYIKISKINKLTHLDPQKSVISLSASNRTIIDLLENTFEGNKHVIDRMKE